jgi:hypothetical protein
LFGKTGKKRIESDKIHKGITATAGGFTVPKDVRLNIQDEDLNAKWTILNLAITKSQTWKWKLLLFMVYRDF